MRKLIVATITALLASTSLASLISYDSFSDAIVSTNGIPAGWTAVAGTGGHSSIKAGSLNYAGYPSTGNSWGLGQSTEDYRKSFSGITGLVSGDHVYYSMLLRLNSPLDAFSSGMFRLYNSASPTGSGLCVGWGTTDATVDSSTLMGFSLSNRNRNFSSAVGADNIKTTESFTAADTVYLVVLGYNRGANAAGSSIDLWVNPDSSSFGATPPASSTLHLAAYLSGYASEATWNTLEFISNGSSAGVPSWQVDEVRIGTDWASTVVPEPATVGMLGLGALVTLLFRRMRR